MCIGVFANKFCLTGKLAAREKKPEESAKLRSGRMALVAVLTLMTMTTICNCNVQFPFLFTSLSNRLCSFSMVTMCQYPLKWRVELRVRRPSMCLPPIGMIRDVNSQALDESASSMSFLLSLSALHMVLPTTSLVDVSKLHPDSSQQQPNKTTSMLKPFTQQPSPRPPS